MDSSSKQSTNFCANKALSASNITALAVSSVARSSMTMVEIFCPSQNLDSRGVVDVSVSEVNFKGLQPKIVSPFLNTSLRMKTMHPRKTQTGI